MIETPPQPGLLQKLRHLPYEWIVAAAFVLAVFMDILDVTIVNVSLFKISKDLNASLPSTTWIVLGYSLSLAIWIPISGWVGDRFGTRRTFIFALFMFVFASFLCGEATSISQLVTFRLLQGVGGGMLTPTGIALLFRAFPPERRARASSILAIPTVLAPASGPVLGGWLTDTVGWRWIFRVNIPIGMIALAVAVFGLKKDDESTRRPLDLPGVILASLGFPAVVYFFERGAEEGWLSARIMSVGVVGVVSLVGLVWWSYRTPKPMLDLRLLRDRLFAVTNAVSFAYTMAFLGTVFVLPQFLQRVGGYTALESGLTTFPQAIGALTMSRVAGKLYPKVGPRKMLFFAFIGMGTFSIGFMFITIATNHWAIRGLMFVRGLCLAFAFIPLQAASYAKISPEATGRASAIFSTQRQLAGAVGVAVLSTVLASTIPQKFGLTVVAPELVAKYTTAFHWTFFAATLLTFSAAGLSLLVRDEDAKATMVRR
jgi:EmrB/QacA subfamily drug resistance transporter